MSRVYKSIANKLSKHRTKQKEDNLRSKLTSEEYTAVSPVPCDAVSATHLQHISETPQLELQLNLGLLYEAGDNQLYLRKALEATRKARRWMNQALTNSQDRESLLQDALAPGAFVAGALAGGREMVDGELRNFNPLGARNFISKETDRILKQNSSQPQFVKNVTSIAESLVGIVIKLEGVICNLLPQSPEYTVPFGFVMIIFKSIVTKRQKQAEIVNLLNSLSGKLPIISLMHLIYPIVKMKILVADIYINILNILQQIANYLSSNPLVKLLDATFAFERYNFDFYLNPIDRAKGEIEHLFQLCHVVESKDIKTTTDHTANVVKSIYDDLGGLSKIVSNLEIAQIKSDRFSAANLVSNLIDTWDPLIAEPTNELELWKDLKFHISAKDHWSGNGILPKILEWQESHSESVLWVSSPHLGRDSWLTQFSLDLIHAAQTEEHGLTFAMCDRPQNHWTFLSLMKQLICQAIYNHPQVLSEASALFNPRIFKKATTVEKVLRIFYELVEKFDSFLVIIDRIDLCNRVEQGWDGSEMLQQLSALAKARPEKLKVIITSAESIPDNFFGNLSVSLVKIDLRKKKRQQKKTDFLQGRQVNVRIDPNRPTWTRMARKHISITTLHQHYVDFMFDQDPEYIVIKRWVPEFEQDLLWDHTRMIRQARRPIWTRMARRHISLTTLREYHLDYELDNDPDFVIIKRWVPEEEQNELWNRTIEIREARFTVEL